MRKKLLTGISLLLTVIFSLLCTCKELPSNPYERGENLKITMFISGDLLEASAGYPVSVGLVVNIPSLVKKLTVLPGDDQKEITVALKHPESSQPDTVYFETMYKLTGKKNIIVRAAFGDGIIKEFPFLLRVFDSSNSLWKQDTMTIAVKEDTTISYSLLTLLKDPSATNVVFSTPDTGVNGTIWKYSIPKGAISRDTITLVASNDGTEKSVLKVFLIVLSKDTVSKNSAPEFTTDTIRAVIITGSQYLLNLKDSCKDSNGDALSYSLVTPSKGSITTTMYGYTPSDSDAGTQTATIIARDLELSDTLTIIFTVKQDDTEPPSVTFTPSPVDTIFSSDTACTISLKALDISGIDRVEVSSDSKNPSKVTTVNDSIWNIMVSSLGSGIAAPVTITVFDKSPRANFSETTAVVKYKPTDNDKPEIQITSQSKDTALIYKSTCEVILKCIDASGIQSVTASNGTATLNVTGVTDSVFSATVTDVPSDRYMPVTFTVTDKSTNVNVSTKTIYLKYDPTGTDLTAPSITLKNPASDNTVIGTSSVTVDILCTDDNGVVSLICEFGGKTYSATKGTNNIFSVTIPGLVKGANVLKVTATDGSTNANTKSASFTVNYDPTLSDTTGPVLTLPAWLTDNTTVESSSITFTAECTDINQVASVQCSFGGNLFAVTNSGNIYSVTVTGLNSGITNVITLTALDGSTNKNKTVKTIAVKVANAPVITIQPKSQTLNTGNKLTLSVTVSSSLPLTYQWYKDNVSLTGATQSTYTVNSALFSDSGVYHVTISDGTNVVKSSTASIVILTSPIAYWNFDNLNDNTFRDYTDNGYTVVCSGTGYSTSAGKVGNALSLTGNKFLLEVLNSKNNFYFPSYSIECWFYLNSDPTQYTVDDYVYELLDFSSIAPGDRNGFGAHINIDGTATFGHSATNGERWHVAKTPIVSIKKWYHIVFVADSNLLKIYLNGQLEATSTYSGAYINPGVNAHIGCQVLNTGVVRGFMDGLIDEMKYYNCGLTENEIITRYNLK
ncbi:MAG: hypothetical protein GX639_18015 [Fibrobacter sp.]|nr:hypothetical protein [Fibrobacter sp.]